MAIEICEVRPEKREDALAFARQRGVEPDADRLVLSLCLSAREDDAWKGAALCVRDKGGARVVQIVLGEDAQEAGDELGRRLMDKALLKLQAAGAHTCRLISPDGQPWRGTIWPTKIEQ